LITFDSLFSVIFSDSLFFFLFEFKVEFYQKKIMWVFDHDEFDAYVIT